LNFHEQWSCAFQRYGNCIARRVRRALGEKCFARILDLDHAFLRHFKHAHFVRRAETIFHRT
jgi:hypothetical protein